MDPYTYSAEVHPSGCAYQQAKNDEASHDGPQAPRPQDHRQWRRPPGSRHRTAAAAVLVILHRNRWHQRRPLLERIVRRRGEEDALHDRVGKWKESSNF